MRTPTMSSHRCWRSSSGCTHYHLWGSAMLQPTTSSMSSTSRVSLGRPCFSSRDPRYRGFFLPGVPEQSPPTSPALIPLRHHEQGTASDGRNATAVRGHHRSGDHHRSPAVRADRADRELLRLDHRGAALGRMARCRVLLGHCLLWLSARERLWSRARLAVPAVLGLTIAMVVTTFLHLDLFHLEGPLGAATLATYGWIASYRVDPSRSAAHRAPGRARRGHGPARRLSQGRLRCPHGEPESVLRRFWHRLPWLIFGLAGAFLSADIVSSFQHQLEENVILAFSCPGLCTWPTP